MTGVANAKATARKGRGASGAVETPRDVARLFRKTSVLSNVLRLSCQRLLARSELSDSFEYAPPGARRKEAEALSAGRLQALVRHPR